MNVTFIPVGCLWSNAVVKFLEQEKYPMMYNNAHEDEWSLDFVRLMNRLLPFIKFIMY